MSHAPYMNLQALPDFSAFQFTSTGLSETITRQVRFLGQKDGKIYTLDLRDLPVEKNAGPAGIADTGDMNHVLATLVQIIEIYTERYPRRIIRLKGNTREKAALYRTAVSNHLAILCPLFLIALEETGVTSPFDPNIDSIAFLLRRKPVPYLTIHTIHTTWTGKSRLFGKRVVIELGKGLRLGLSLPQV